MSAYIHVEKRSIPVLSNVDNGCLQIGVRKSSSEGSTFEAASKTHPETFHSRSWMYIQKEYLEILVMQGRLCPLAMLSLYYN
jgi:hypothetical protein